MARLALPPRERGKSRSKYVCTYQLPDFVYPEQVEGLEASSVGLGMGHPIYVQQSIAAPTLAHPPQVRTAGSRHQIH